MSPAPDPMDQLRQQANDLYWTSSDTVEQLASELGMSRKGVYSAVQPLPTGTSCLHCNEVMVFANRTNRAAGLATCPTCGTQTNVDEQAGMGAAPTTPAEILAKATGGEVHAVPQPQSLWEQIKEDLSAVPPDRAAKIGGAAALGVAIGAAAARVIKTKNKKR
jgi:hypothetical protein